MNNQMTEHIDIIKKIAKLARIKMNKNELEHYAGQINNIMKMIDKINDLECDDIEPFYTPSEKTLTLRSDEFTSSAKKEEIIANAPGHTAQLARQVGCFIVPKALE
ncbi:MAG: Asp-tRNA(Asn)/Glu-tRNA(Gln) amidotransferase subunit GatC [Rickettsiaceae bacterium]|nr:Asp-tRNA(Asn)/Glu-tRNA(Gln) amidotransferase subunit GatC [Rickettsiaceae bacterium]